MIKFITEYCPIIIFFIFYKIHGIFYATGYMMVATIIALAVAFFYEKKLPKTTIISSMLLLISSGLTLLTGNTSFIKIKPTILYTLLGTTIYTGLLFNKLLLKSMLKNNIILEDKYWIILSKRFSVFFLSMAIVNEVVWRNFSENFWVNYKLFGTMALVFIFIFSQLFFLQKHIQK
jgi:intracellular septation protein